MSMLYTIYIQKAQALYWGGRHNTLLIGDLKGDEYEVDATCSVSILR